MPVGSRAALAPISARSSSSCFLAFSVAGRASTALSSAMARAAGSSIDSATASASSGADSSSAAATRVRNMALRNGSVSVLPSVNSSVRRRVDPREHFQHLDLVVHAPFSRAPSWHRRRSGGGLRRFPARAWRRVRACALSRPAARPRGSA